MGKIELPSAPSTLRILRISHSDVVPSYRQRVRELMRRFDVKVDLALPERWSHLGFGESDEGGEPFAMHRLPTIFTGNIPLFAFDLQKLAKLILTTDPHVIDIHEEPYSTSSFQAVWLAQRLAPRAACVVYSAQNIRKAYPPPFCWSERYVLDKCLAAYPCSTSVLETLREKGFQKAAPVIALGVDTSVFQRDETARSRFGIEPQKFVIGFAGRLEPEKGIPILLAAARLAAAQLDVHVLVAGTGSMASSLMESASGCGLKQQVQIVGEQTIESMPSFYSACDLVVVPSRTTPSWKEQFGRVVVEAMACRTPVIVSSSGSLPEIAGDAALVYPEDSAQALAQCILQAATNAELRSRMIEAGLRRVKEKYTWQVVARDMYDLYVGAASAKQAAL